MRRLTILIGLIAFKEGQQKTKIKLEALDDNVPELSAEFTFRLTLITDGLVTSRFTLVYFYRVYSKNTVLLYFLFFKIILENFQFKKFRSVKLTFNYAKLITIYLINIKVYITVFQAFFQKAPFREKNYEPLRQDFLKSYY